MRFSFLASVVSEAPTSSSATASGSALISNESDSGAFEIVALLVATSPPPTGLGSVLLDSLVGGAASSAIPLSETLGSTPPLSGKMVASPSPLANIIFWASVIADCSSSIPSISASLARGELTFHVGMKLFSSVAATSVIVISPTETEPSKL